MKFSLKFKETGALRVPKLAFAYYIKPRVKFDYMPIFWNKTANETI